MQGALLLMQVNVRAGQGSGQWAGFDRDKWHKGRLLAILRGKDGVRKTLDFSSIVRTGHQTQTGYFTLRVFF